MIGKFRNNTIGSGAAGSGSAQGNGLQFNSTGLAAMTVNVTGNNIRNWTGNYGIDVAAGDGSPVVNFTVTGNSLSQPGATSLHGIHFNMGTTSAGAVSACADIGGAGALVNSLVGSAGSGGSEIRVRQRNSSTFRLPGLAGAVDAFLAGRNTVTNAAAVTFSGTFSGGAACTQAP
jgi:hypothetical protein